MHKASGIGTVKAELRRTGLHHPVFASSTARDIEAAAASGGRGTFFQTVKRTLSPRTALAITAVYVTLIVGMAIIMTYRLFSY